MQSTKTDGPRSARELTAIRLAAPVMRRVLRHHRLARGASPLLRPFNPFSPDRTEDPYPLYEKLRERGPVTRHPILGVWYITGLAECETVLRSEMTSVDRRDFFKVLAPYKKLNQDTLDLFLGSMLMLDEPEHERIRKGVNRVFSRRAVAGLTERIEKLADQLVANLPTENPDYMGDFAFRLPLLVLWDVFGVPPSDHDKAQQFMELFASFTDPMEDFDIEEMESGIADYRRWVGAMLDERKAAPTDDLLTVLTELEDNGELNRGEICSMMELLTIAGFETTSSFLGNCFMTLRRYPEFLAEMRLSEANFDNGLEEILRLEAPAQVLDRLAVGDIEVGGKTIKAGSNIGVVLGAANRDPRVFDEPDQPRLGRKQKALSMGTGAHHCLGSALAMLEARVAIPRLLEHFERYEIDNDAMRWKPGVWGMRGPKYLPLTKDG